MPVFLTLPWLFVVNVCLDSPQNKGGGGLPPTIKGGENKHSIFALFFMVCCHLGPHISFCVWGSGWVGGGGGGG